VECGLNLMLDQFIVPMNVAIRACREEDLQALEWFGLFTDYRELIAKTFKRHEKGEVMMLVAEANHFPIGQVWIDLVKKHQDSIGLLWALRVMPCLQDLGIGSRLISTAERAIQSCGLTVAEIAVEKDNPAAKLLYKRLGVRVIVENTDE